MASSRKSRAHSNDDDSDSGARIPPPPRKGRHSEDEHVSPRRRRPRSRYASGYSMHREKSSKVDLLLCVFHGPSSHTWRTAPFSFDRRRTDDREIWEDIRRIYREELQKSWRRIFLFTRLKYIVPIEVRRLYEIETCPLFLVNTVYNFNTSSPAYQEVDEQMRQKC